MDFYDQTAILASPLACRAAGAAVTALISSQRDPLRPLVESLNSVRESLRAIAVGIACQQGRDWITQIWVGDELTLPYALISEALDANRPIRNASFVAIPIGQPAPRPSVQLLAFASAQSPQSQPPQPQAPASKVSDSDAIAIAQLHAYLLAIREAQAQQGQRVKRLETMLKVAAQWTSEETSEALLKRIAVAASELLNAERASIFLWNRDARTLIGQPALGVEGNRLEVSDSEGIVGAVLQSGQPRRWHTGEDLENEVNRKVDKQLSFQTRSLLAVPLWEASKSSQRTATVVKPIGVFELINRIDGVFTEEDEKALEELAVHAAAAIQNTQVRESLVENRERLVNEVAESAQVIGQHSTMAAVRNTALRVAETDLSVLVLGENGTGKEVLARSIHFNSPRRHQPFVAVNCAALVETLLESELFGHEKGAFTDAHQTRQGKFEVADGGTLFLDEIGDLSASGQAKLLRVLEERKVVRVGGSTPIPVNVRVIAATNQPLVEMVQQKRFREDLYFRLNIVTLQLPALRDRGSDISLLAEHFLAVFSNQIGRKMPRFTAAAREALQAHSWPGNIRELRNLVERVAYLCPSAAIDVIDLGLGAAPAYEVRKGKPSIGDVTGQTLADATRLFQISHIEQTIAQCRGNMTDAAGALGLHRSNLYRKLRQLGLDGGDE